MGFRYCKFCHGDGCLACPAERIKHEKQKTKDLKNWQPPNKDVVDFAKNLFRQINPNVDINNDELEARLSLPDPIMTVKLDNDIEMELAKKFIGGDVLKELGEQSGNDVNKFHELFLQNAENFRVEQGKLKE